MKAIVVSNPLVPYGEGVVYQLIETHVNPQQFAEVEAMRSGGDVDAIAKMTASLAFRPATDAEFQERENG